MLREGHKNADQGVFVLRLERITMRASTAFTTEPTKGTEIFLSIFFVDSVLSVVNYPVAHSIRHSILSLEPPQ